MPVRQTARPIRRKAVVPAHAKISPRATASTAPVAASQTNEILGLQRTVGNQAVQRLLKSDAAAGSLRGAPIRRLMTAKQFKTDTDAGFLATRGKTLKEIERLLDEYHALRPPPSSLPFIEKGVELLTHLDQDVSLWMETHEGDTSRSRNRVAGMLKLRDQIRSAELPAMQRLLTKRLDSMAEKGLDATPKAIGENTFKMKMDGDVSSVFRKLSPLLDMAAPNPGDSGMVEIELKVPVDPSGVGFLGFRVMASIERGVKKATKLRFELVLTGGAKIPATAELKAELGGYIETQGKDPAAALELVSYGLYRRFRESRIIPNEVTNFMWGGSGTSVGWKRSEKWAAKVEKDNFKKKPVAGGTGVDGDESGSYSETGMIAGVSGKFGIEGVASGNLGAKYGTGKHYDYDSITNISNKKGRKKLGEVESVPVGMRGGGAIIGESVHSLEISGGVEGGPFSGSMKLTFGWATEARTGRAKLNGFAVELSAAAQLPMGELVMGGIGGSIPPFVASIVDTVRKAQTDAVTKTTKGQDAGFAVSLLENATAGFSQLAQVPKTAFVPKFDFNIDDAAPVFSAPVAVKLTASMNKDFEAEFKLDYVKSMTIDVSGVTAKLEKSRRLLKVAYKPGDGWSVS
ncbi:MAG: hypothetical protein ABI305_07325 [Tepidiformaceae bacterium]